ncbi:MAG: MATE family efflux transporter [Pseudomonadota bacterium]
MRTRRVLKNTLILYVRQIFVILVNLYALRVVLNVLGVEDYGIYSIVAGVVTLSTFFSVTMASATQRFFSYALGLNDYEKLKKTFSVSWLVYACIALLVLVVLETVGIWFLEEHLAIPSERFEAAQALYHLTVLAFVASIFNSPFMAILIAHEDMHIYAYLSIVDALMKLGVVFALSYISWDKLELYGYLLLAVAIINAVAYFAVCLRKYPECQFRKIYWDKTLLKEITDFTGWTTFGALTSVARNQGVTILLNQMFNPATVAARAIAMNVASQVSVFANNFNTGLYPPIIKSYAANEKAEMFSLITIGSKLTFFLMWIFTLPLLLEMSEILKLWLNNPPQEAILFTQLALIEMLILSASLPLATAARAPGKMKSYEIILGVMQMGIFAVSWWVLKIGYPSYSVFIVAILFNLLMLVVRLLIVSKLIGLNMRGFFERVLLPLSGVIALSAIPAYVVQQAMPNGVAYGLFLIVLCMFLSTISMYHLGLDTYWRKRARIIIFNCLARFRQ